jgi:hypothetical protein
MALAPAFAQALPSLDGIATEYNHEVHAELLFDLCATLVRAGMGTPETWQQCAGNAIVFAKHAMTSGIGAERGDLLQRNGEYQLQVSDVVEQDGYDASLGEGQLAVTIECSGCGYLKIGPAIDALEEEAEGLGAAFYWMLTYALYRVMRLYNHDDAATAASGPAKPSEPTKPELPRTGGLFDMVAIVAPPPSTAVSISATDSDEEDEIMAEIEDKQRDEEDEAA